MTQPNIFLVAWWFDTLGGMERHVTDAAIALEQRGCKVTVFSEMPVEPNNQYIKALKRAGIWVVVPKASSKYTDPAKESNLRRRFEEWRIERRGKVNGMLDVYRREQINCLSTRDLFRAMERQAKKSPPTVIHIHGCRLGQREVMNWASARDLPCVYTEHVTIGDWGGPFDASSPSHVAATADVVATVSKYSRDSLLTYLPEDTRIEVLHHVVRDPWLENPNGCLPKPSRDRPASILAVGRLSPHKGYEVLLRAVAMLRDAGIAFQLKIAGSGEQQAELEQLRASLNLADTVTFLGHVQQHQVTALWGEADIAVLPSLTEGLPLSIVEAMAQGRPVVASSVGGIPEVVVDGQNGLLAPPGEVAAFAEALRRIITDPALAASLAKGARETFERGGWSEMAVTDQLLSVYELAARARAEKKKARLKSLKSDTALDWAKEAAGPLNKVYFCAWHVAVGDMERLFTEQACALAEAGVEVTLFVEQPLRRRNPLTRAMRAAGVRIIDGSRLRAITSRTRGHFAQDRTSTSLARAFTDACAGNKPDAVYVHGWRLAGGWASLTQMIAIAVRQDIPTVYVEHATEDYGAPPPDKAAIETINLFGSLSAASPAAAVYLKQLTGDPGPVTVIRHAGRGSPAHRQADINGEHTLTIFSLLPPTETERLEKDLVSRAIRIAPAGPIDTHAGQISQSDAVVLSPDVEGYSMALAEAMSSFKPVVISGKGVSPINHRANGFTASPPSSTAVIELASDPLLAHQLAREARRTYETNGLHSMAVIGEAVALYRVATKRNMSTHAGR